MLAPLVRRPRRLVYLGTPQAAVPPLQALVGAGFEIALVVTRADTRRGRGGTLSPSPVKAAALDLGLSVTDRVADVLDVGAELGVVVAFGRLIKLPVLEALPLVNVHFSLLPRWRGAAPVERAILAGDTETGVCLMRLEEGLDTGPVFGCRRLAVGPEETADELRDRLVDAGVELLVSHLRDGLPDPEPQVGEATYAAKIEPAELAVDWSRPAVDVHRLTRLGRAWTTFRGRRLRILRARLAADPSAGAPGEPGALEGALVACGSGAVELVDVQPEGKAAMPAAAWLLGARPAAGERLGA